MAFTVDPRILATSVWLSDSVLSSVYLKNDATFPWFILVPRVEDVQELYQLNASAQQSLMEEISRWSTIITAYYQPNKLNVGALGNIVSQLHVHIVARFTTDVAWPSGIWQPALVSRAYDDATLIKLVNFFQQY